MIKRFALLTLIAGLGVFVALGLYRRFTRAVEPVPQAQPRALFGPCEDHRTGLPYAPAAAGLDPSVLAFSSDCRWLASGNRSGSIQVFDRESGRLLGEVGGFGVRVTNLLISPDDKYLFSSTQTGEDVLAWSMPNLARVVAVKAGGHGSAALAFDPVGGVLITGTSQDLQGWKIDFRPGGPAVIAQPAFAASAKGVIQSLALSPDARYIAAGETGSIQVWKYENSERPSVAEVSAISPYELKDWVLGVAFSTDGKVLVSGDRRKQIGVWQIPSLEPVPQAGANPPRWDLYNDPWKFTARPPRDYAGIDKAQLVFRLHDSTADRVYAASAGLILSTPVAQRGRVQAMGNRGGISFFDVFENRSGPTLSIPTSRVAVATERPDRQQPELGAPVEAEPEEAAPAALALSDAQPPRELASGAEIFLISGYQAGRQTRVRIKLDRPGKRVLLVLTSYERVVWQVDASATTAVTGILVSAYRGSTLQTGLKTQAFAVKLPYAYQTDNRNFGSLLEQLNGWFGISRIDAFRGAYSLQPIIEISQADADNALLTLAGPPVQAPSRNFRFVLHTRDYSPVIWTLTGQDKGRNLGYIAEGKFAVSPGGAIYSLKRDDLAIVDRKTGTQRDFPLPGNFPAFSWPMDVAYDSRRDIVSVISLGGEGFFYRFDARAKKWIDFRSMNNIDVYSLAYDKNLDRYVAWTDTGDLLFISGEGHALFKARVTDKLPGFGRLYDRNNSRAPRIGIAPDGNNVALVAFSGDSVRSIWEYEVESQIGRLTYRSK